MYPSYIFEALQDGASHVMAENAVLFKNPEFELVRVPYFPDEIWVFLYLKKCSSNKRNFALFNQRFCIRNTYTLELPHHQILGHMRTMWTEKCITGIFFSQMLIDMYIFFNCDSQMNGGNLCSKNMSNCHYINFLLYFDFRSDDKSN